ncbi:metallophosphoesterase [Allomeiothermus silvanus DSM 9946]|uniref:Metallophosphoesterase n=1 Tax=Allomeiothermus silvanus (strain ATCC 700542 / DSM 9946 / NBRC 106475 / NCIMB 13440 / VI-R2) TaxID=526227 RepID=D7BEL3_ALLS1|nr:metallophosphoesterase family protein [Allomeiothermus silvanus]ADH63256.1 metallophosphoesterase [Allomeiothermus silvanus DSM 9946]
MRIGIIADIHANLPALEAALTALREEGVDQVLAIGDLVGYGPHPRQVLRLLEREGIACVLGSADIRVAFNLPSEARSGIAETVLQWTITQLGKRELNFLRNLRSRHRMDIGGGRLLAFHGTPDDPEVKLDIDIPVTDLVRMFEQSRARYMVAAGKHIPYERRVGQGILVDPGSVGLTLGGEPGADVLLLEEIPQAQEGQPALKVRFLKVPYDFGQVLFDLAAWELPPVLSDVIRQGRFPG